MPRAAIASSTPDSRCSIGSRRSPAPRLRRFTGLPRVAVEDERLSLGLPEVMLGIHPGFGGTVRTVRIVGVRPAMEMMLTGKPLRAAKALSIGLVDKLVLDQEQLHVAARDLILRQP